MPITTIEFTGPEDLFDRLQKIRDQPNSTGGFNISKALFCGYSLSSKMTRRAVTFLTVVIGKVGKPQDLVIFSGYIFPFVARKIDNGTAEISVAGTTIAGAKTSGEPTPNFIPYIMIITSAKLS